MTVLRAGAGGQGRPRRRPARHAADHRSAHARQGLRRSSPRSTCAATGSTATCCTSAASGSARAPAVGSRAAPWLPGTRIGQDAEIAPGSRGVRGRAARGAVGRLTRDPDGRRGTATGRAAGRTGAASGCRSVRACRRCCCRCSRRPRSPSPCCSAAAACCTPPPPGRRRGGPWPRSRSWRSPRSPSMPCSSSSVTRLLGLRLREGHHPVRSRIGWQVWATERLMDEARTFLFPLYASLLTPVWLRALGATVGRGVEASTVLLLPKMTTVGDEAFLADDTLIGSYELGGGWLRIERAKVGKRAFLGNSGMTAPGRRRAQARPGGGAVGRAREGQGRHVVARAARRSSCAAPPGDDRRRAHLRAGHRASRWRAPSVELGRLLAGRRHVRARRCACVLVARAAARPPRARPRPRSSVGPVAHRRGRSPPGSWPPLAKWLLVGRRPRRRSTRCGARSCGATRSPTPSSRWSRRRGSLLRHVGDAGAHALAALRWAPASAGGCGARPTGCPRPTSSRSATGATRQPGLCAADPPVP